MMAYDYASSTSLAPEARARVLDAAAGLHLTRREWTDMAGATTAALSLLLGPNYDEDSVGSGSGDGCYDCLIGDLLLRLALAGRQQNDARAQKYAGAAAERYGSLPDPLRSANKQAQVHREMGTWYQEQGNFDSARVEFRRSGLLLADLPSQRLHVLQAHIKTAQVELMAGDLIAADLELAKVREELATDSVATPLATQVGPHYLVTDALYHALCGNDAEAAALLARLGTYGLDAPHGASGGNQERALMIRMLLMLPVVVRRFVLRWVLRIRPKLARR